MGDRTLSQELQTDLLDVQKLSITAGPVFGYPFYDDFYLIGHLMLGLEYYRLTTGKQDKNSTEKFGF